MKRNRVVALGLDEQDVFFPYINFCAPTAHVIPQCGTHSGNHFITCNKNTASKQAKGLLK